MWQIPVKAEGAHIHKQGEVCLTHCYNPLQPWLSPPPPLPRWTQMAPEERNSLPSPLGPPCWISSRAFLLGHKRKTPEQVPPFDDHCYLRTSIKSSHNMLWACCFCVACEYYLSHKVSFFQESITQFLFHPFFPFCSSSELFSAARELKGGRELEREIKQKLDPFAVC